MGAKIVRASALGAVLALCLTFVAAASATERARKGSAARSLPGIRIATLRANAATEYTIHSVGAPPGVASSYPIGFNNTGQIFGSVVTQQPFVSDCRVWTGAAFVRPPFPAASTCAATAIDDANASGEYEVVGSANLQFSFGSRAFAALARGASFIRTTIYYRNAPSVMVGVNAGQTSVAQAELSRDTAVDYIGQLYFTTVGAAASLAPLQALAAAGGPPVHNLIGFATACAFGGCLINDRNEVLGYDNLTSQYSSATLALYTVGEPASLVHLPLLYEMRSPSEVFVLNDLDEILYFDQATSEPALFTLATGARMILPALPADCPYGSATPLSLNNRGEVLGFVTCGPATYYFTWDPVHGIENLNAQLPSSAYTIYPLGVNDGGQILVRLVDSAGVDYWGTLDPAAAAVKTHAARR